MSEKSVCHWQVPGVVDGQILEIQKPRLGWPSWDHEEKLGIGLRHLGQGLGEELMRIH